MQTATIAKNQIPVVPSIREDGTKWLTLKVTGYEDIEKLGKKVLVFNGESYIFRGWNSDNMDCFFIQSNNVATFLK